MGAGSWGTCVYCNPKVLPTAAEASLEINHTHLVFVFYHLGLVAFSLSLLILFVICQARMSEARSDSAHFTLFFFLPSLVTTFANFRRSAHLANL